jgi:hypothetical protein
VREGRIGLAVFDKVQVDGNDAVAGWYGGPFVLCGVVYVQICKHTPCDQVSVRASVLLHENVVTAALNMSL